MNSSNTIKKSIFYRHWKYHYKHKRMNFCIGDMRRSVTCIMTDILDKCIGTFGQIIAPYVLQISLLIFAQKR